MNERIRELAEQANMQYVIKISDDNEDIICVQCDNGFPTAEQFEKFAELIVRECANQCDLLLNHKMSSEWARGTHDCSKAIKKHFGVEE